jgi:hypothetical protein
MLATLRLFDFALALHILGVVVAFGALFAAPIAVPAARKAAGTVGGPIAAAQLAVSRTVVRWGGLLILVTGIYMASKLDVFSEWWVSLPLVLIIVILGVNDAFLGPRYRKLVEEPGDEATAVQTDSGERALALLVLLAIFTMVLGPIL